MAIRANLPRRIAALPRARYATGPIRLSAVKLPGGPRPAKNANTRPVGLARTDAVARARARASFDRVTLVGSRIPVTRGLNVNGGGSTRGIYEFMAGTYKESSALSVLSVGITKRSEPSSL